MADVGLPFWVRVSAVNGIGESEPSEPLKLRCALPPGMQPAPTQLEGDLRSIVLGFSPENLHGADLLYHRLTYAFVDEVEGILDETIQLDVPGSEVRVNIFSSVTFLHVYLQGASHDGEWFVFGSRMASEYDDGKCYFDRSSNVCVLSPEKKRKRFPSFTTER